MRTADNKRNRFRFGGLVAALVLVHALPGAEARKTRNIVLVTFDGVRPREVFGGIDPLLMHEKSAGMREPEAWRGREGSDPLRRQLWDETPEDRRRKLMPFFWKTLVPNGVVLGNAGKGS